MKLIYFPSYLLAILWTFFWGLWRFLFWIKSVRFPFFWHSWGRHESPEPIKCECGWAGPVRWLVHTYGDDGSGEEVELVDECPRCGSEI